MWKDSIRNIVVIFQTTILRIVGFYVRHLLACSHSQNSQNSRIDIGPTLINFWNFFQALQIFSSFHPKIKFLSVIYSFWQSFLALHLFFLPDFVSLRFFKVLRLLFFPDVPGPTFIPCPTFYSESSVASKLF